MYLVLPFHRKEELFSSWEALWGAHGGGAFFGKDPTKVDWSGAYIVKQVVESIVAVRLARRCIV